MVHYRGALNLPAPDDHDPFALLPQTVRDMIDALELHFGAGVTTTDTVTAQSGWQVDRSHLRLMPGNGLLYVDLDITRTGSAINAAASGDVGSINVCQLPSEFAPARAHRMGMFHGVVGIWHCGIATDVPGMVRLYSGPPNGTIGSGRANLRITTVASFE